MADETWQSLHLDCDGLEKIDDVARQIVVFAGDTKVWTFQGEMGSGKTTLIRCICQHLGVVDNVSSPTFSLVNEYQNNRGEVFYHFDFYRIKDETEAFDIGTEDYFYSGDHCLIEWPSKVVSLIPERYMNVEISVLDTEKRSIQLTKYD